MHAITKYITACSLTMCFVVPAFAADVVVSSATVTDRQSHPARDAFNETPEDFNKDYLKGYVTDFGSILTSPLRWDTADWITAALVSGAAVGLYDNDVKIQKWVLDHKTTTSNTIGDNITYLGFGYLTVPLVGGMYLYGYMADDGKMRETALLSVESFVLTGVMVQTLKYSTHRHRPYADDGPYAWDGPSFKGSSTTASFPSGHASSAFAIATVIASEYDNAIIPPLAYGIAAITGLNRASHNAHWASDIFVGSAIGYFTGKAVVAASHRGSGGNRLGLVPVLIDERNAGIAVTYKY